jgi:hypothetical protein
LVLTLITANDFRARLRFPRVTREPPCRNALLRGLTLATSPAGVCVLYSNQPLEQADMNNDLLTESIKKSELIRILIKEFELKFGLLSARTRLSQPD